jgi:hypothetical protein
MDTSEYPSLPNLAQVHARLAAQNLRVEQVVDAHLDGIERLFHAATTGDWEAIALASRFLAKQDPAHLDGEVIRRAQEVCEELARARSRTRPPKHLASLLSACRSARRIRKS